MDTHGMTDQHTHRKIYLRRPPAHKCRRLLEAIRSRDRSQRVYVLRHEQSHIKKHPLRKRKPFQNWKSDTQASVLVSTYLIDRYTTKSQTAEISLSNIEVFLHKVYSKNKHTHNSGLGTDLSQILLDSNSKSSTFANRQHATQILSPLQILDMLCPTLYAERIHLNFNYLGLRIRSHFFLVQVNQDFKDALYEAVKLTVYEDKGELPMIDKFVLGALGKSKGGGEGSGKFNMRRETVFKLSCALQEAVGEEAQAEVECMQNMLVVGWPYEPGEVWDRRTWEMRAQGIEAGEEEGEDSD